MYRVGFGYDVHRFAENRKLILGGVEIPFDKGLEGHSDADVLLHAISDALLGAAALGDIGQHFPNSDEKIKNIDSGKILQHVMTLLNEKGFEVVNIDSTICAEQPKIFHYVETMREKIADLVNLAKDFISIKATTNEKMGFVGRGEGIAAFAVVLIKKREQK